MMMMMMTMVTMTTTTTTKFVRLLVLQCNEWITLHRMGNVKTWVIVTLDEWLSIHVCLSGILDNLICMWRVVLVCCSAKCGY
jgi:hypothetical protein